MARFARSKHRKLTLSYYVRRRNGVPLGASGSLRNMFYRSLGSGSFAEFWRYWNPVFGLYLSRYIFAPLKRWLPPWFALILTFAACGALHDVVGMAVIGRMPFLFTPWFFIMGTGVVVGEAMDIGYARFAWSVRALINLSYVGLSLVLTYAIKG